MNSKNRDTIVKIFLSSLFLFFIWGICLGEEAAPAEEPIDLPEIAGAIPEPPFMYLIWDGHRFGKSRETVERDFRWYKDLGYTHSLFGRTYLDQYFSKVPPPKSGKKGAPISGWSREESLRTHIEMTGKYGIVGGSQLTFFAGKNEQLAEIMGLTQEQAIQEGLFLLKKGTKTTYTFNPLHPGVIKEYTEALRKYLQMTGLAKDGGKRVRLFLMGSEHVWPFPKSPEDTYPQAMDLIKKCAAEDGVTGGEEGGEDDDGGQGIKRWWGWPHEHGREWRLRKALEDEFLKVIPNADFMIDPTWSVKLVNGFGGTWTYITNDPKWVASSVVHIKTACRPSPAAHSTQLIRTGSPDMILTANLLAICMGIDKLYHWGTNTFEPGRETDPNSTPDPHDRAAKEPVIRTTGRLIRDRGEIFGNWQQVEPQVAILGNYYGNHILNMGLMTAHIPFDLVTKQDKVEYYLGRKYIFVVQNTIGADEYNALVACIKKGVKVYMPKDFQYPEGAEPFPPSVPTWEPLRDDKRMSTAHHSMASAQLDSLIQTEGKKVRTLLDAAGFKPYADSQNPTLIMNLFVYQKHKILFAVNDSRRLPGEDEKVDEKGDIDPDLQRTKDVEKEGAFITPQVPQKEKMSFTNLGAKKKAGPKKSDKAKGTIASVGQPLPVDILIRDTTKGLRVLNVDTGKEVKLVEQKDGYHIMDTIEPAWYRIYAILGKDEKWDGPEPLQPAPAVTNLTAEKDKTGPQESSRVVLNWKLPFTDWVGCDIARYKIQKQCDGETEELDVEGRIMTGPGGVVTSYTDAEVEAGKNYTYQIQAVSPLRLEGPPSNSVKITP